jgi:hypothetical protein
MQPLTATFGWDRENQSDIKVRQLVPFVPVKPKSKILQLSNFLPMVAEPIDSSRWEDGGESSYTIFSSILCASSPYIIYFESVTVHIFPVHRITY